MRFNNINSLQIFQVLQFGTAVLIGILLAKSGLPTEQISIYEALIFIASLYCFFWIVGGQNTLLQLFPGLEGPGQKKALFNVYLLFTLAALATGGLLLLTKDLVAMRLTSFNELPHLDLLAIFLILNCPSFLISIYYLLLKKFRQIVAFGCITFTIQLLVVVVPIYMGYTLREVMWGLIGWAALKFVWGLILLARHARWKLDFGFWKAYLPLAVPLLLLALISKGSEYVSGLMVTALIEDEKAFAIFRYGAREFPLAVLMVGALATSLIPEVSEGFSTGLQRIKDATRRLSHWLFPLSILSILVSPFLFPLIFNPDFKESARIFNIYTLLLSSRILLPHVAMMALKKNYFLSLSAVIEFVVLIFLSWWWGKLYGLEGIAAAAVAAFLVDRVLLMSYLWKVLKIPSNLYVDWKTYLGYNALMLAAFFVSLNF